MRSVEPRNIDLYKKNVIWQLVVRRCVLGGTLAAFISATGCAGPNSNSDSVTYQVAVGERFLSAGEYSKGYEVLDSVGHNNPKSADAALKVADAYFTHHAYLRAKDYYETAIAKGNRIAGGIGLGRVMLAMNQAAPAEKQFLAVLSMHPHSADARNGLGVSLDLRGRHEEAQKQYHILLERYPSNRNGNNNLALSYLLSGKHKEASSRLGELARSYLDDRVIRQNLAISQILTGDRNAAENTFALDMNRKEALHNIMTIENLSRRGILTTSSKD